ncbi:MAG TPA: peptidylprolyl isomerase [Polyangiaceae bacterium]|nr:peptidylprolyl isomerase [Polyangiaceae bacterium]
MKRRLFPFFLAGAVALTGSAGTHYARATVVERIVAVVGERAILLSDLRTRARPILLQVHQSVPEGAQRNAAISQVYKTVLDRLIDEELQFRAAQQAKLTVSTKEIDEALSRLATQNKLALPDLLAEAERSGLTEASYRDELRRQLLEAKLVNTRLQGRIRVVDEDLRQAYQKLAMEERQRLSMTPAWILIPAGKDSAEQRRQRELAERVSREAQTQDFAKLAAQYSDDKASRATGGRLASTRPAELPPALARVALGLEVGQVSAPVRYGDHYAVLKVLARDASELPDFEQARQELTERVYIDKMTQAKKTWLDGLRRQHHVEIRL